MKKYDVKCPYCGVPARLRPANFLYGKRPEYTGKHYYVCTNYPVCDAYVAAHHADKRPMGFLANGKLRQKRKIAHIELNKFQHTSGMTKWAVYVWLAAKMGLNEEQTHIGKFTENQCDQAIQLCRQGTRNSRKHNMHLDVG